MNKLFTKIAALALGATMAVGVGVAVASNREAAPVHAASEELAFHFKGSSLATDTTYQAWSGSVSSATTSKVSSATWQITVGNNSAQLGTNAKSGNLSKTTLGNGNFSAASGVATALSITTSTTKYSAVYCTTAMANITKGELIFTGTNGGNITTAWLLSSTDGSTWTIESSKTSSITTGSTFTVTKSSTAKQFAFVCYWNLTNSGGLKGFEYKLYGEYEETQTITVDPSSKETYTDETFSLTTNATSASWALSNNSCGATLSAASGKTVSVSATGAGSVRVTATASGYTSPYVDLNFIERPTSPYITPGKSSTSGYTGQNESLSFTYGNLTGSLGVTSSNTSVVTVETPSYSDGEGTVQINFVGAGSTTVKFNDGSNELASVSVSVTASSVTITGLAASNSVYIGKTLNLGSTITVTATGIYSNAVTWSSDDDDIATVSAAGVVTGVSEGTAHISVTSVDYPSAKMSCNVTVSEEPLQYVMTFGATKTTSPTEIKTDKAYHDTYESVDSDVVAGDFSKIYGNSSSQLKCGSGSAAAKISFTIPSTSYITSVVVVVATAGGTSLNVTSSAEGASTENQNIAVGTLTFDDYLASEKSNKVTLASTASGAFYLSSITINYANFTPELHASSTSVEAAVNTSNQSIDLTYDYFTPTGYTAVVKSGSSLSASAVAFNTSVTPHTATFTTGSTTGATVFTITGTGGGKSASVDVTVTVTEVRNLLTLTITTASDATSFKVGQSFDVGSLVVTATFDAAPTTVVYSKANGNLGALTFAPAIGYEFVDSDIGTVTSVIAELEIGTGDLYINYTISVSDKTYATQVTSVTDLWDGQQIYFGASDGSKVNIAHAGGNQLGSQTATVHATKGLCVDDLEHKTPYTVHREQINDVTYYSFQNGGYYLEASNTSNNYLTRTDTLSDNCRYTISISSGEVTMTNKGNSSRPEFRWNSGSSWFSQYQSSSSLDKAIIFAVTSYSEEAVAASFEENWLHMSDYTENKGWCADEEHAYYSKLKPVWAAMGEYEKAAISSAGEARLIAWAAANGETLDSNMDLVSAIRISPISVIGAKSDVNVIAIVVITSVVSLTAIGGYFFLRKRKENI